MHGWKANKKTSFLCCKQPVNYVSSLQKYDRRILFYKLGAIENKVNTHIYSTVQYDIDVCIVSVFYFQYSMDLFLCSQHFQVCIDMHLKEKVLQHESIDPVAQISEADMFSMSS